MGLISCFSIGHLKLQGRNSSGALPAGGAVSFFLLFILLKSSYIPVVGVVKRLRCTPRSGLAVMESLAILIGLAVGGIYTIFYSKHIVIKMPEQSSAIASSCASWFQLQVFSAVRCLFIDTIATGGVPLCRAWFTCHLGASLRRLTGLLYGAIVLLSSFFLWCLASTVCCRTNTRVVNPMRIYPSSRCCLSVKALIYCDPAIFDSFLILSGSGITFGGRCVLAAKSKQYEALGKLLSPCNL